MNYGKKGASKRQKQIASKSNMKKKRVGVRVFKALVACLLLVIVLGAVGGGLFIKKTELARLGLRRQRYGVMEPYDDD